MDRPMLSCSPPSTEEAWSEGGLSFCDSSISSGDLTFSEGSASPLEMDVFVENLLLHAALPLTELALEGELERKLSGGGLVASGSAIGSRDIPGSCFLPDIAATSAVSS